MLAAAVRHLRALMLTLSFLVIDAHPVPAADPRTVLLAPELLTEVNRRRAGEGLTAVGRHVALDRAAQDLALDLAQSGRLEHTDRLGRALRFRIAGAGYRYRLAVENLARGQASAGQVVEDWLASHGHRQNLFRTEVRHAGIGVAVATGVSHPEIVWVLMLAEPLGEGAGEPLVIDLDQGRSQAVPLR